MRTMKPKAKLKKNVPRFRRMKLTDGDTARSEPPDLSILRQPIDISLSSLKQVAQLLEKGNEEVKAIITYECDVIYECRICRSLFRSLANFISHKRVYCLKKHNVTLCRRNIDPAETIYDKDSFVNTDSSLEPGSNENCTNDRILRSQSVRKEPRRDLTSVVDMLKKRRNDESDSEFGHERRQNNGPLHIASDGEHVLLEIIDSKTAAYQTILRSENSAAVDVDLMKSQAHELKSILNRNTGVLGPDGQLLEVNDVDQIDGQSADEREINVKPASNRNITCTICNARFSTKKTLTFHVKSKHIAHRMIYPCPFCTSTFTNRWSVYRHLFKVHRKSSEQVRRLRSQIQSKAFRTDLLTLENPHARESEPDKSGTVGEEIKTSETQNLVIAQEWMQNLELDAELQRCGSCGKRFERKAALVSHLQICQKRGSTGEAREITAKQKRARKIPPQRVTEHVEMATAIDEARSDVSAISTNSNKKFAEPIVRTSPAKPSPLSLKPSSSLIIRKTQSSMVNKKTESSADNRKTKRASVERKSDSSSVDENVPMEISIRVEDVSSLSKDMWDKIGTSENTSDRDSVDSAISSSRKVSSPLTVPTDTTRDDYDASKLIPEVIYTSIDNSQPVALSVLGKEKKLGIQYRGIRLPTVTLEKINVPRPRPDNTIIEPPSVTCKPTTNESTRSIQRDKIRQTAQIRKLHCPSCNRKFMSVANLRKHVAVHLRRSRYGCKLCDEFKSLLKCDIVAHCNKEHNAKNNRTLLAELVVELPLSNDSCKNDKIQADTTIETRHELQVIDVGTSIMKQMIEAPLADRPDGTIDVTAKSEGTTLNFEETSIVSVARAPAVRPKRGRPPSSRRKGRRGKRKIVRKARIVRSVSPPRLTDDCSDEINDIGKTMIETYDSRSAELSRNRAPSRLDRDPELRKMVMEVIFGSSENEPTVESQMLENDSTLMGISDEPNDMPERQVNAVSLPTRDEQGHYRDNELKTTAINRDAIVLPEKSNYMAIQLTTDDSLVRGENSVSSLPINTIVERSTIRDDNTAQLIEAQQTDIRIEK